GPATRQNPRTVRTGGPELDWVPRTPDRPPGAPADARHLRPRPDRGDVRARTLDRNQQHRLGYVPRGRALARAPPAALAVLPPRHDPDHARDGGTGPAEPGRRYRTAGPAALHRGAAAADLPVVARGHLDGAAPAGQMGGDHGHRDDDRGIRA